MPLAGHPDDCACCVKMTVTPGARGSRKRPAEEADLSAFLPPREGDAEEGEGAEQPEGVEEEAPEAPEAPEEEEAAAAVLNSVLFQSFDAHVARLDAARLKRIEALTFKSALEVDGEAEVNEDASLDELEGLGVWQAGDEFQGDVNYRTLQRLLARVDQRGFERCAHATPLRDRLAALRRGPWQPCARQRAHAAAPPLPAHRNRSSQQLEFHVAFMKAAARVIYRGSWETERPAIMRKHGWEKSNSEVLIRRARTPSSATACPATCSGPAHAPLCAQHPSALREDVLVSSRPLEPDARGTSRREATPPVCAASPSSARASRSRLAWRCAGLGFGVVPAPHAGRAQCQVVVFSPARRASRKLLERIVECPLVLQPAQHPIFPNSRAATWQVCAPGRRREAHLRVQPGGLPDQRLRRPQVAHPFLSVRPRARRAASFVVCPAERCAPPPPPPLCSSKVGVRAAATLEPALGRSVRA